MRMRNGLILAVVLMALLPGQQAGAADPSKTKASIKLAYTEFRSGLRHSDGELACSRMTLHLRGQILGVFADELGTSGVGCEDTIDRYGRAIYNEIRNDGRHLARIALINTTRARARTTTGGSACFRRDEGRWKLHSGGKSGRRCKL